MKLTIEDIRRLNEDADFHFFDESTLRFFDSIIEPETYGPLGTWFLTSEQPPLWTGQTERDPRMWTIRRFDTRSHQMDTVGEFRGYESKDAALAALWHHHDELERVVDENRNFLDFDAVVSDD